MEKEKTKKKLISGIKVICSVIVCAAGIQFLVLAGWGMDPLTGLESALADKLNITLGRAALIFEGTTFCIFLFVDKSLVNFGSFAFCFGIGPCIDFWAGALSGIGMSRSAAGSLLLMVAGSFLIIVSIAYYVPLDFGLQSLDMYSVSIARLLNRRYGAGLTVTYLIMTAGALCLGVRPGITTLAAMTTYGYLIDKVRNIFDRKAENRKNRKGGGL